jgi:hypothetical protein
MSLSTELREALVSRHRPRLRKQVRESDAEGEECYGISHIVERLLDSNKTARQEQSCALLVLPPASPNWSHLLCGRPHEAASATSARTALLAVGCRLSISPTTDVLREAAGCHSGGAVRRLLAQVYGERGLALAYQLAGREQSHKPASRMDRVKGGDAVPGPPDLLSPEALRSMPPRVARFFLHEPLAPRWRTGSPSSSQDDGAWVG